MENSHLNLAHLYGRKAEHYAKDCRFDEAIEHHRKAANSLEEALKIHTSSQIIQESLQLQRQYHLKQAEFLRVKKQQYERYMRALEYQRRKNPEYLSQQLEKIDKSNELQVAVYQNLDDTEGFLEALSKTKAPNGEGEKSTVMEALFGLNHSLHILIQRMVQNFDEYAQENESLREKLKFYEREKENNPATNVCENEAALGKAGDTAAVAGYSDNDIPALAPLELPTFDLSEFDNH